MTDVDVVVVGGGPVGESLLVQLGHRGIRAVGFERDADVWPKPRAVHFDGEVFRSFQPTGLADSIASMCVPMSTYRMENEAGEVLLDIPTDDITVHGWIDSSMFNQPEVDTLLRNEIGTLPSVELRVGCDVTGIHQTADAVHVIVNNAVGEEETITASYLVACDGASSSTRAVIDAEWERLGPDDKWLVADGILPGDAPIVGSMVFFGHHSRPHIWAAMPNRRARMEFKVMPGDDVETIATPETVERLSGGVLTQENFHLDRTAVYTFRSRVAVPWRANRIFLAGDAAHLTPPLFGQGLCSGMRDAVNLAWKLDLVLHGGPDSILDTYETERSAHARGWIAQATQMSTLVQTTDPNVAAQRDAHVRQHPEQGRTVAPALGPGLHSGRGAAGTPAPQPISTDGRRFDDIIGRDFAIVGESSLLTRLPENLTAAVAANPWVQVSDETLTAVPGFLDALRALAPGARAAVIRPDRYLVGTAETVDELTELLHIVLGACGTGVGDAVAAGAQG